MTDPVPTAIMPTLPVQPPAILTAARPAAILRPARAFDAAPCAAIVSDWIDENPWLPCIHDPADIARHYREAVFPAQAVTVAEAGGEVAGFMARDGACITSLYLARGARGGGVGARLLDTAKAGTPCLTLWAFAANTGARRFYAREGFVEAGRSEGENDEGLPDVQYRWTAP